MSRFADKLRADARAKLDELRWDERDKARAIALATEHAELTARGLLGEDVAAELRHVEAQAANIAAAEGVRASNVLRDVAIGALTVGLRAVLG